jgi:hypothetical protein
MGLIPFLVLAEGLEQARAGSADITVHEWGTFTSLQASDGAPMVWRTQSSAPLPRFVHNEPLAGPKYSIYSLQRMETPVIYFYSEQEQDVDLKVRIPRGRFTESYPRIAPASTAQALRWMNFQITPKGDETALPQDQAGNNYFSARETDSDYVSSRGETEKFLFYRGIANFPAPLRVSMTSQNTVTLSNAGPQNLEDLFVLGIENSRGEFFHVEGLKPGEQQTVTLNGPARGNPVNKVASDISLSMAAALKRHGLFGREAIAMVQTWKDSWFKEEGVRVLYLLPRPWTDAALPIEISPAPKEMTRVMVGRAELITPKTESDLVDNLIKLKAGDPAARARVQEIRRGLGRFAEAALRKAIEKIPASDAERAKLAGDLAAN